MSSIDLIWKGEEVTKLIEARLAKNLRASVTHVAEATRSQLPQDTGRLAASVQVKGRHLEAYWGSDVEYASDLEFGANGKAPDGTWRRVLDQEKATMVEILKRDD
jgi:hypothetical protein